MKKFAVIDIGSNSVRLLVVADGTILYKRLNTTRLGEGLAKSPRLLPQALERTAQAVAVFYERAQSEGAEAVYAYATAAVRSAENRGEFLDRVQALCGLKVEVLSGETEAEIGLLGALGKNCGCVIDIGGASTELVVKKRTGVAYKKSVDAGIVRLKDECGQDRARLEEVAKEKSTLFSDAPTSRKTYAIGGTATTLAAQYLGLREYEPKLITGTVISVEGLQKTVDWLAAKSTEEIAALPCMPKGREDVIVGGGIWLLTLMKALKIPRIIVSDRDNLEGYAMKRGLMR